MEIDPKNLKLVIGLGNPGKEYEKTHHNVGFLLLDHLTKTIENPKFSGSAEYASDEKTRRILNLKFSKSDVYMNHSGEYVKKNIKKYGVKPEELLIAHDDSDIFLGDFKISFDRGAAGHKGIESIISQLKTKKFWRIRIGIRPQMSPFKTGNPRHHSQNEKTNPLTIAQRAKASEFVLKKISPNNQKKLDIVFKEIVGCLFG